MLSDLGCTLFSPGAMAPKNKALEKQRAMKAVKEMKACGFPMERTKSVLKELLKTYDHNWDFIENENYSVLVEQLISSDDDAKESMEKKNDPENDDEGDDDIGADLCRKRQKRKLEDSYLLESSTPNTLNMNPMPSTDPISQEDSLHIKGKGLALGAANERVACLGSSQLHRSPRVRDKPDCPVRYAESMRKLGIHSDIDDRSSDHSGSPRIVPAIAMISPCTTFSENEGLPNLSCQGSLPLGTAGDAIIRRESNPEIRTMDTNGMRLHAPSHGCNENGVADHSSSAEIASSSNGKVKLSLSWENAEDNFRMPKLETITKMVEDKCLKAYKVIQPKFSLLDIMTEICQAALELGQQTDKRKSLHGEGNTEMLGPSNNTSFGLVAVRQYEPSLGDIRPIHDVKDVTKGQELVKISVVNDFGHAECPPSFFYISHNIVYQNGHVNFSLARIGDEDCCTDCFGDCLSASIPCTCARETGGEFAYNIDGLLKKKFLDDYIASIHSPKNHHLTHCKDCPLERSKNEDAPEPCKGHLVRKFIKECWVKCGCHRQCGNRVVQRGITRNLQVFFTGEPKGWGLRTLEELPRGAFVCEYIGEVLTNMELYDRTVKITGNAAHTYPVLLDADWGSEGILKDEEALCLDATFYGNVARFINHRCFDANLMEIPVEIETADRHYYHLAFFTTRKVEAMEELTWDYGIDFDDHSHPIKSFTCKCGSKSCRDMKRSARSKAKASVIR